MEEIYRDEEENRILEKDGPAYFLRFYPSRKTTLIGGMPSDRDKAEPFLNDGDLRFLAGFAQKLRDEELGRYRMPQFPDHVIYLVPEYEDGDGRCIRVVDERVGTSHRFWEKLVDPVERLTVDLDGGVNPIQVAAEWFAANSVEDRAKPWVTDSKPGEVWLLTINGKPRPIVLDEDRYFKSGAWSTAPYRYIEDEAITAGVRIWSPESSEEVN